MYVNRLAKFFSGASWTPKKWPRPNFRRQECVRKRLTNTDQITCRVLPRNLGKASRTPCWAPFGTSGWTICVQTSEYEKVWPYVKLTWPIATSEIDRYVGNCLRYALSKLRKLSGIQYYFNIFRLHIFWQIFCLLFDLSYLSFLLNTEILFSQCEAEILNLISGSCDRQRESSKLNRSKCHTALLPHEITVIIIYCRTDVHCGFNMSWS